MRWCGIVVGDEPGVPERVAKASEVLEHRVSKSSGAEMTAAHSSRHLKRQLHITLKQVDQLRYNEI